MKGAAAEFESPKPRARPEANAFSPSVICGRKYVHVGARIAIEGAVAHVAYHPDDLPWRLTLKCRPDTPPYDDPIA